MEPAKYSKPSGKSSALNETVAGYGVELNLPDEPGFVSLPPRVSMGEMIVLNRRLRSMFPEGLKSPEERWKGKTDVPFQL